MNMDSIYSKLKSYGDSDFYPYHMPGHKRKKLTDPLKDIADIDITEIYDFDNLADPTGILKNVQDSLADYLGVEKSYFLVNGSTVGILAAISAVVPKGGKLLLARNAHKSTYNSMCIRDIEPTYIYPNIIEGLNICEAVSADQIAHALAADRVDCSGFDESDDYDIVSRPIDAVIVVSPTYEGRIADIKAIAEIVHSYGIPLIVDEAHGAHLGFVSGTGDNAGGIEGYTKSACQLGADIVIQSLHKTIPAPTQTAVMHINSDLVDIDAVEKYLHVYQTSSPSYVLMAAMEASINYMKEFGADKLSFLRDKYCQLINDINSTCIYIEALPYEKGIQDPGKFIFSGRKAGLTGKALTDILRRDYHLEFEMCVREYVLAIFTVADEADAYDRLRDALISIDKKIQNDATNFKKSFCDFELSQESICLKNVCLKNETVIPMSAAWDMKGEYKALKDAEGCCANDFIGLYPPGTPILVPGERITSQHVENLNNYIECGYEVTGVVDGQIRVIE